MSSGSLYQGGSGGSVKYAVSDPVCLHHVNSETLIWLSCTIGERNYTCLITTVIRNYCIDTV